MATTTTNLSLTKPAGTDTVNIALINGNMDKIDSAIGPLTGTIGSTNNLVYLIQGLNPGDMYGTGSSYDDAVDAAVTRMVSTATKGKIKLLLSAIHAYIGDSSKVAANSCGLYHIPTSSGQDISGMIMVDKRSATQYVGVFIPLSYTSVSFFFRLNSTYSIRYLM